MTPGMGLRRIPSGFLLLTGGQLASAVCVGLLLALVCWPWYGAISWWIGGALFVSGFVVAHLSYTARIIVILPHIAILVAALQYVLAAWISYYYPPTDPMCQIGLRMSLYLSYAAPMLITLAVGWFIPLFGLRPSKAPRLSASPALLVEFDVLLALGVTGVIASNINRFTGLSFVLLLVGNLRYVGVYGRMLAGGRGWLWRLAIIFFFEVSSAASTTMFHDLLLWSCWTAAIWVYCYSPRPLTIVIAVLGGVILLPSLQASKWQLRNTYFEVNPSQERTLVSSDTGLAMSFRWLSYMTYDLLDTLTFSLNDEFVSDMLVRYNQGWIVNRVMLVVPGSEPYAHGETLKEAIVATVLPRALAENKMVAGGRDHMLRFAEIELNENTAMTLGFAGEMYANFGLGGGVIACGLYALGFGLLFRFICRRAFRQPLWWCVVPYVFYSALKAEDDIGVVLNWTVKSCVVIGGIIFLFPHLRQMLFARAARTRAVLSDARTSRLSSY